MTDIFYGILTFILVVSLIAWAELPSVESTRSDLGSYNGYVVTDHGDVFETITVRKGTTRVSFRCSDLVQKTFPVGDTIHAQELPQWNISHE